MDIWYYAHSKTEEIKTQRGFVTCQLDLNLGVFVLEIDSWLLQGMLISVFSASVEAVVGVVSDSLHTNYSEPFQIM